MSTPHISAMPGEIAETVLLPGDPLRAKYIAENFLEDAVQFNAVRNIFGYTGTYNGKRVSVMATGMGCASIGIYSYELIHMYGVKNLIRIGSCGTMNMKVKLGDIVMAMGSCTDTSYARQYNLPGTFSAIASYDLLSTAVEVAKEYEFPYAVGNILCTDVFYNAVEDWRAPWAKMGCIAAEMESYALYCNAAYAGVNALAMFTVSDNSLTKESMSAEERQTGFINMMKVALGTAARL